LCWEDGDIQKTIAKGHTAAFHLAFSQENITRTQKKHIASSELAARALVGYRRDIYNDSVCQYSLV
jgi:hypothetical protein